MPSPLAHVAGGYATYQVTKRRQASSTPAEGSISPVVLLLALGAALLPDVDAIAGLLLGNFGRFHNNVTHSILVGLLVAIVIGGLAWLTLSSTRAFTVSLLVLVNYQTHIFMDFLTDGRGVMLFWPFTATRYESPILLFYGLHWSEGLISIHHLITLANEAVFVAALGFVVHRFVSVPTSKGG